MGVGYNATNAIVAYLEYCVVICLFASCEGCVIMDILFLTWIVFKDNQRQLLLDIKSYAARSQYRQYIGTILSCHSLHFI